MPAERIMVVSHTGQISGAELVLLDVVQLWPGAAAFLFEDGPLKAALSEKIQKVQVARWGDGLAKVRRNSSVFTIASVVGRMFAVAFELGRAVRHCDVMYANSQKAFVLAAIVTMFVRRPLVWHLHDIVSAAHFGAVQRRVQIGLANRCASRVIVPSQAAALAFIGEGGRPDLVQVVANGLDVDPDNTPPAELRRQLGLPDGNLVGVFSRLAPWKGQHVLLQALAEIPDVNCILAGDALFGEGAYAERLDTMVRDLGLAGRVHFLGQRNDVARLMRAVDIIVHPSIDPEPFGRTLVEGMLAGVPVIATDTGAASDILESGRAGTLVPPDDAGALASAMRGILSGRDRLSAQLEYAGARARAVYSRSRMLDGISQLVSRARPGLSV